MPVAVTQPAPSPFFWGDNGVQLTPAQIAGRQQIAAALLANQQAPHTIGEGLNSIGDDIVAKAMMNRADAAQASGTASANAAMAAAQNDPDALLPAIENQFLSPGQQMVAQAILNQRMMATNPDQIAQRAYLAAETAKDQAQANEMTTGGPNMGNPIQDQNTGNFYAAPTYGTGLRQLTEPGQAAPPAATAPVPLATPVDPSIAAPSLNGASSAAPAPNAGPFLYSGTGGVDQPPVPTTPVASQPPTVGDRARQLAAALAPAGGSTSAPAPVVTPASASIGDMPSIPGLSPTGGSFMTAAQGKLADSAGTAEGATLGGLPAQINDAISSSRSVNPLYSGAINNVNRAINAVSSDNGAIDFTTGLGGKLGSLVPGQPGYDLAQALHSLTGLSALATMSTERGNGTSSPIQIRNQREFQAVASAAGSLDQFQSKAQLLTSLKSLKAQLLAGMNNRAQDIGDMRTLGKLGGGLPTSTAADPYAGPGAYGLINAAPDGIPTVTTPQEAAAFPSGTKFYDPSGTLRVRP